MDTTSAQSEWATHYPEDHPTDRGARTGLLLLNLGTPDGTDYWSMRRYLSEFLSDRRVIDLNPIFWQTILQGIVLTVRPSRSGKAYASIWNNELDESPLRTITRSQAEQLAERLKQRDPDIVVDWAMRYGNPSTQAGIEALRAKGCTRIVLLALYPQYSATTTATAYDKAFDWLKTLTWQPAIRTAAPWHDEDYYIEALARSVREHYQTLEREPEVLVTSFHGLPKRYLLQGDPYHCHCAKTARLLREKLGWPKEKVRLAFQSRFGSEEWLQPYTDKTVIKMAAEEGIRSMAIIAPAFFSDCVETLEELCEEVRDEFLEAGGEHYTYVPCLNDTPSGMDVIETVALRELGGWIKDGSSGVR